MKNAARRFAWIPVLIGAIVILAGAIGYEVWNNQPAQAPIVPAATTSAQAATGASTLGQTPASVSNGAAAPAVAGMSKYTDAAFGFSFWYPSGWQVTPLPIADTNQFPGGTVVKRISVGEPGAITITEVHAPSLSITDTGGAGPFGPIRYFFDMAAHQWMVAEPPPGLTGSTGATSAADVSKNTIGGLHMFVGTSRFDTSIIPLSAENFLVVSDGGAVNARYLASTVIAADPSVATPASLMQQAAIIQAEQAAYSGQSASMQPTIAITGISGMTVTIQYANVIQTADGPSSPRVLLVQNEARSKPLLEVPLNGAASGTVSFTLPADAPEGTYTITPAQDPSTAFLSAPGSKDPVLLARFSLSGGVVSAIPE